MNKSVNKRISKLIKRYIVVELDQFKYRISGYDAQIENIKQSLDLDVRRKE